MQQNSSLADGYLRRAAVVFDAHEAAVRPAAVAGVIYVHVEHNGVARLSLESPLADQRPDLPVRLPEPEA